MLWICFKHGPGRVWPGMWRSGTSNYNQVFTSLVDLLFVASPPPSLSWTALPVVWAAGCSRVSAGCPASPSPTSFASPPRQAAGWPCWSFPWCPAQPAAATPPLFAPAVSLTASACQACHLDALAPFSAWNAFFSPVCCYCRLRHPQTPIGWAFQRERRQRRRRSPVRLAHHRSWLSHESSQSPVDPFAFRLSNKLLASKPSHILNKFKTTFWKSNLRETFSAARRRDAEMSGDRRFRRDEEIGGVSKPGGGGGAIRLQINHCMRYWPNLI